MKVFDAHFHLESKPALYDVYDLPGVTGRNVIFNSVEEYFRQRDAIDPGDRVSLIFDYPRHRDLIRQGVEDGTFCALKIHSRDQRLVETDYPAIAEHLREIPDRIPLIVDAFYYGHELRHEPSLSGLVVLAAAHPSRNVIVAHSGGYELLKYFFHLRTLPNIHYDLSLSLQYLSDSSIMPDLVKLIRFTDKKRILFGTDYPWASPSKQFDVLTGIFDQLSLSVDERDAILHDNARRLFG